MKATYTCEICGHLYDTPEEANACEANHKKADALEAQKTEELAKITGDIEQFVKKYGEFPSFAFSAETVKCLNNAVLTSEKRLLDELRHIFD